MATALAASIRATDPASPEFRELISKLDALVSPPAGGGNGQGPIGRLVSTSGIVGLVAAIGVLAPTVQSLVGNFIGPSREQLERIEAKVDMASAQAAEAATRSDSTIADLVRFVAELDEEQARASARPPRRLPPRLRAIVALDDVADETD